MIFAHKLVGASSFGYQGVVLQPRPGAETRAGGEAAARPQHGRCGGHAAQPRDPRQDRQHQEVDQRRDGADHQQRE